MYITTYRSFWEKISLVETSVSEDFIESNFIVLIVNFPVSFDLIKR